ncbi:MAG: phosphoribosyl-AMP cyclohydrolase [gamma proteobacterium symbiont of Bathyaustriella thionipta]|nr:phosphoribosyl-AMP cyclohydrolase [gamma proteobacterium symbiont of Bathyaustriella thionipta]MCU7949776.1 phosphoribosyl-AMP cyclohydrolase [gamma proteobacterium symbiont of Bathyaustriella thionipta]MCU7951990.1 phosphoribosyl-AMP cyclohydrolase [gamma proteobacterium symbiont of Bathyaustriella thionipta]MCU7956369.1 phosphoribosyl-AMP cyclohydrolase [gamma proteobacterium symbiont of Bathyaustriella thionipta]MCU7968716.1 phosphoribosyl-AMP cyclohydrolase [gamma proteobacterium symbion
MVQHNDQKNKQTWLDELKWDEQGLIPAIAQDEKTGKVVMFAWMNRESLAMSIDSGRAVYWSRSRAKIWPKGEESGHVQKIKSLRVDCDKDVVLMSIEQIGGIACHTGRESCFYFELTKSSDHSKQWQAVEPILKNPDEIYKK